MVMQATIIEIVETSGFEFFQIASRRISCKIMHVKYFFQVR